MNFFTKLYQKVIQLACHPKAPYYLAGVSTIEAVFFPIPPDVMLAPMALTKPTHAFRYAGLTTVSSVLGGLIGYLLGMFLFSIMQSWLYYMGYEATYLKVQQWFLTLGIWGVIVAAFTPIPYKLFTIAAGAGSLPLFPFIFGSLAGRGARFYLVSALMRWKGQQMERMLLRYIEWIGWTIAIVFIVYIVCRSL